MDNNEIIIKLKGSATARKYEENELFQKEKFKEIRHILEVMLKEISGKDCDSIEECRNHDTIFVDGERGAGKTAFLLNIEDFIKNSDKNSNEKIYNKFKFFRPVDPTLLENSENFLSVVIARIVEEINKKLKKENSFNNKEKYFRVLNELGNSIGAIKELKEEIGLDEIASYASSIKLEEYAHHFFKTACEIFEVEKLIVLIDDVDMAFDKGFEVLEVIRKYLASPYIIPVVAGDYSLYRDIIRNRFRRQFTYYKEEFKNEMEEKIDNMTEQYLQKVFPMEFRVELSEIENILKNNKIKVNTEENYNLDFDKVIKFDRNSINLGINRKEEQFEVIEYNARKLTKYLYRKKDILNNFKDEIKKEVIPDINELKSSYEATAEFYKYDENKEKRLLSQLLDNDVKAFEGKYNLYKAFKNKDFYELKIDESFPKEFLIYESSQDTKKLDKHYFYIQKKSFEKEFNQTQDEHIKYILHLFTLEKYFSSYQTRKFIISGKFIELMIFSMKNNMNYKINIPNIKSENFYANLINGLEKINIRELAKITNEEEFISKIKKLFVGEINEEILKKIFNKIKSLDSNSEEVKQVEKIMMNEKIFAIENNESFEIIKEIDEESEEEENINNEFVIQIAKEILLWNYLFISRNYLNSVSLIKILKKFYENLKILKQRKQPEEDYLKIIARIVIMFINSIAFYENDKSSIVSSTFVSLQDKFDLKNLINRTPAININIKPLLEEEKNYLTKVLFFHPLIRTILLKVK